MALKYSDIVLAIVLNVAHSVFSENFLSCDVTRIPPDCPGSHQVCNETSGGHCECEEGYIMVGNDCELPSGPIKYHTMTAALATMVTLALLFGGFFLVVKRYQLIEYVRQKINERRSTEVMYEDVMIGQDEPPLSP